MNNKEIKAEAKRIAEIWIAEAERNNEGLIEVFSKLGSTNLEKTKEE